MGNQGGFRTHGRPARDAVRLAVLYTSGAEADWPDALDPYTGSFTYFGDNRSPGRDLHDTPRKGNLLLSRVFEQAHGGQASRAQVPPFLLFDKPGTGRDVRFRGLLAPGSDRVSGEEDLAGTYTPLLAPPTMIIRSREQQQPAPADKPLLDLIYQHFRERPHDFEQFAADMMRISQPSVDRIDVTRPWRDGAATQSGIGSPLTGDTGGIESVAFSPDGRFLAAGSDDHTARLWDVATHQQVGYPLTGHTGLVNSVAFSPDGKTLATGSTDGTVRLWNVESLTGIATLSASTSSVFTVAFSPGGTTLATGSYDHTARLWNVGTHQQMGNPLTGHTGWVKSVAFSPDGKILATGSADGTARLWNVRTHRQIGDPLTVDTSTGSYPSVNSVAFSPAGKTLVTGSADGGVRLWDVATHRQMGKPLGVTDDSVESVAFSPDGKTLATATIDGTVLLWKIANHPQIEDLNADSAGSVAFSRDRKTLATGSADDTARLWDVATHRQIGDPLTSDPLTGDTGWVTSVAFSPDGKILASGSKDGTVRLWDIATHQQIGDPLTGYTNWVTSVAFSPNGKTLGGASDDGSIRLWNVAYLVDTVPILCASAGRTFTHAEWARYVPDLTYQRVCPLRTGKPVAQPRTRSGPADVAAAQQVRRAFDTPQSDAVDPILYHLDLGELTTQLLKRSRGKEPINELGLQSSSVSGDRRAARPVG